MDRTYQIIGVLAVGLMCAGHARGNADDKSQYTLFNPTPPDLMRELSTDRPDKTESPYTVDAGHVQIEMDIVSYVYDHSGGLNTEAWDFAITNFKVGLLNHLDFQIIAETYKLERVQDSSGSEELSGYGDTLLRTKLNLWGDDGGKTALAIMPFVKLPTSQDDLGNEFCEYGVIVPFAIDLGDGWGVGMMTEFDILDDASHWEWVNSIALSRDFTEKLGGYVEFFSSVDPEDSGDWVGTVDFGFTYLLRENVQLDGGVNVGVTEAAEDFNPFIGLTIRF